MYRGQRYGNPHSPLFTKHDRADAAAHALRLEFTDPEKYKNDDYATFDLAKDKRILISQEDIDCVLLGKVEDGPRKEDLKIQLQNTSSHEVISVIDSLTGDIVLIKETPIGSLDDMGYDKFCEELFIMAFDVLLELWNAERAEKAAFEASYTSSLATKALRNKTRRSPRTSTKNIHS